MIGIFDSGIGGTTILHNLEKLLPHEDFIYYADSKNNPYGDKTPTELLEICKNIVDYFVKKNCKLVVIACNTASTICLKELRTSYPNMIFIGTVPPIKVALDNNYQNILVMGTPLTIKSKRLNEIIETNRENNSHIYLEACPGLASAIEKKDQHKINLLLHQYLDNYQSLHIDAIVLGCTHYPLVKTNIKKIMPRAKILDSISGVSKEVIHQLKLNNLEKKSGIGGTKYINMKWL